MHPALERLAERLAAVPRLDAPALEAEHVAVLGRKSGELTALLKSLATLPLEDRKAVGAEANRLRDAFTEAIAARRAELARAEAARTQGGVDLTMPGLRRWTGARHPVTQVVDEITAIFARLGFVRATGPEAESEWLNFLALNFPPDHPAMDMHDTLYLDGHAGEEGRMLLRTHTSPVQIRVLRDTPPPVRVIMPGTVYRKDPFDPSHAPMFTQIEGLAVDEGISFVDLKATLAHFARAFFGPDTRVRFRPSFFPFTEPSAEMDVACRICGGSGCPACKQTGWMEILGCGMVHPKVLENCSVDSERYTGFAFGMGPERIAMNRFGLPDIRLLYEGDMRFLGQFA
ncbi:MAG: phenylalanine--tRNA ligase subunit alpha [Gemmatimonadales bacterium]